MGLNYHLRPHGGTWCGAWQVYTARTKRLFDTRRGGVRPWTNRGVMVETTWTGAPGHRGARKPRAEGSRGSDCRLVGGTKPRKLAAGRAAHRLVHTASRRAPARAGGKATSSGQSWSKRTRRETLTRERLGQPPKACDNLPCRRGTVEAGAYGVTPRPVRRLPPGDLGPGGDRTLSEEGRCQEGSGGNISGLKGQNKLYLLRGRDQGSR